MGEPAEDRPAGRFFILHSFSQSRGCESIYEYLQLSLGASAGEVSAALEQKLAWAEASLRVPKLQREAQWLLLNRLVLRAALLESPDAYRRELHTNTRHEARVMDAASTEPELDVIAEVLEDPAGDTEQPAEPRESWACCPEPPVESPPSPRAPGGLSSALALLVIGGALIAAMLVSIEAISQLVVPQQVPADRLIVRADPPTGAVYFDERLVGSNGYAFLQSDHAPDQVTVRIEADGFAPWSERVSLAEGVTRILRPALALADTMDYQPSSTDTRGEESKALKAQIKEREASFRACFAGLALPRGTRIDAKIQGYITSMGVVGRVNISDYGATDAVFEDCIKRQLRALRLPYDTRDYAPFQHTFHIEI